MLLPRTCSGLLVAACFGSLIVSTEAYGQGGAGRLGMVFGGRLNHGVLGKQYKTGVLVGFQAGYHPYRADSTWSLGVSLTTFIWDYYFASQDELVVRSINLTQFDGGLRLRRSLGSFPGFVFASGGGSYVGATTPIPPVDTRTYWATYAGGGYEMLFGQGFVTLEAHHSFLNGPRASTILLSYTFGVSR